jgi:hypothetical protein
VRALEMMCDLLVKMMVFKLLVTCFKGYVEEPTLLMYEG